jgi:RsiW-degrading membrane proteinase PrsW (M82 family)
MNRSAAWRAALCACLIALLAYRFAGTPAVIVGAALLPALAYALLIARIGRLRHEPPILAAMMFLWGAGAAALLSQAANDAAQAWLATLQDPESARALTPRLAAPAIEEAIKAAPLAALLLRRSGVDAVLDGIVYGALIGIGFALAENTDYFVLAAVQGGESGLLQSIYLRGVLAGLNHAAFTATVGAALGWGVQRRGRWPWAGLLLGLALAIVQHVLWNAFAAGALNTLACNPSMPGGACNPPASAAALFVAAPLIVAACIGPALLVLAIVASAALRREAQAIAGRAIASR